MTDASKEKQGVLLQGKLVVFQDKNIRRSFRKGACWGKIPYRYRNHFQHHSDYSFPKAEPFK